MKNRFWIILIVAAALACFSISILFLLRSDDVEKPETIIERMPSNHVLNWYTSLPLSDAESISNAFTTETGIGVKIVRDSAFIIREQLLAELLAGTINADVLTIADIGTFIELKDKGELLLYNSPFYTQYASEYKDSGYWAVFAGFGICMAYNEDFVDNPPARWTDLLSEKWKGRIGLEDISTAGSQYGQYYMLRELLGVDFWDQLLSLQKPRIYFQTSDLAQALLKGEIDIAGEFTTNTVYNNRIRKGIPIQGIYPSEGVPFVVNPTSILFRAKHPDESKIFINYLLSHKGQGVMQNTNYKYSVLGGITPLKGIPPLNTLNVLLPENAGQYSSKRGQYIQEFEGFLEKSQ